MVKATKVTQVKVLGMRKEFHSMRDGSTNMTYNVLCSFNVYDVYYNMHYSFEPDESGEITCECSADCTFPAIFGPIDYVPYKDGKYSPVVIDIPQGHFEFKDMLKLVKDAVLTDMCEPTEAFKKSDHADNSRKTWVFCGDHVTGKSTFAAAYAYYSNRYDDRDLMTVYETDAHKELNDILDYDVILVGYRHTLEDVQKRIPEGREVILVNFSKA